MNFNHINYRGGLSQHRGWCHQALLTLSLPPLCHVGAELSSDKEISSNCPLSLWCNVHCGDSNTQCASMMSLGPKCWLGRCDEKFVMGERNRNYKEGSHNGRDMWGHGDQWPSGPARGLWWWVWAQVQPGIEQRRGASSVSRFLSAGITVGVTQTHE